VPDKRVAEIEPSAARNLYNGVLISPVECAMRFWLFIVFLFFCSSATAAVNEEDLLPVDEAFELSAKETALRTVEFSWKIAPGYYLYRHPMRVSSADSAFKTNTLQLPEGKEKTDPFFGKVQTYREKVVATQTGAIASGVKELSFEVKYQGCADIGVCYPPQKRIVRVAMPISASGDMILFPGSSTDSLLNQDDALPEDKAFKVETIVSDANQLLVRMTPAKGYYLYRDKTKFEISKNKDLRIGTPQWPAAQSHKDDHFGDVQVYFDLAEIPLPVHRANTQPKNFNLTIHYQGCKNEGICYAPMQRSFELSLPAGGVVSDLTRLDATDTAQPTGESIGFGSALLLAFIGGLILNLMPCVLPILSLKVLGVAGSGQYARAHAIWYTAGVVVSFLVFGAIVIGLREAGQALGWGFQLQQPWLVASLALLMVAIGLNLSSVFEFGGSLSNVGQSLANKRGAAGDFFTGVLAVVVASPCTAPFMANGLAYAFIAPPLNGLLVFAALGLGLALPFLLIGFVPALARLLPKPGAWMQTMKQWLALPMYLTAVWLAWVFGNQAGGDALAILLIGAVLLAMGLWWYGQQRFKEGVLARALAYAFIAAAIISIPVALQYFSRTASSRVGDDKHEAYSAKALADYRAQGRIVFVDMTADWCITCKVNEKAVLHTDSFSTAMKKYNAVYMVGDYTNQDEAITAFLKEHKAVGVPLYVMFPKNGSNGEKLPQILSTTIMQQSLQRADK
jgi:thiol:disulfide interchange protein